MENCLFCRIISKEIPNYTVYEDDYVLAFLDIFPHAKGHTVLIPKIHVENLEDLSIKYWHNVSVGLKKTLDKINDVLKPDGCNIGINNKKIAGQVVPHIHWHIIPRYNGDGGGSVHSIIKNPGEKKAEDIAKLFK